MTQTKLAVLKKLFQDKTAKAFGKSDLLFGFEMLSQKLLQKGPLVSASQMKFNAVGLVPRSICRVPYNESAVFKGGLAFALLNYL